MNKHGNTRLLLLVVLASLLVSLCACGGDTATTPAESTPPVGNSDSPAPTGTAAQTGEPSYGGSVTVGIAQDLDSLDPHKAANAGSTEVLFNIFEGLVKASPDGGVTPAVASDYTVSDDGLTYTFTLRDGVTFHNGEAVTAEDVIYSLERCAGSENDGTPLISAFSNVAEVSAPDGGHITVTLSNASLEFIYSIANASIMPAGSGDGIAASPIGTGPFQFVSYTPQESMTIRKYEGYWGAPAYLDEVTFRIITNSDTLIMSLKGGSLDMTIHLPSARSAEVEGEFTILSDTMKLVQALYLNNLEKPFDDVRVRQALSYAINVPEIIEFVCNGHGVATGTSMYPAYGTYFMPELAETYATDLDKARELLTEAGYPDGFEMTITVPSNYPQHVQTTEVIVEQLKQINVTATIVPVEWETWVSDIYRGRQFQSTVCGIAASDMTAREMLVRYMTDDRKNFIGFSDAEYDDVVARAQTTLDEEEQIELYKRAEVILNEQAASVWLQDLCDLVVMRPDLEGMQFYRTYVLDMSTIYFVG